MILRALNSILLILSIFCLSQCTKDEYLSLDVTEITLYKKQTYSLKVSPDLTNCVFKSEYPATASVSSTGIITACLVGETTITVTNVENGLTAVCKVIVAPLYSMFKEPFLDFDKSKAVIKSYETRSLILEDDTTLSYSGENQYVTFIFYEFENSKYGWCSCIIPLEYEELLYNFLMERYVFLTPYNDFNHWWTSDHKIALFAYKRPEFILLIYEPTLNWIHTILNPMQRLPTQDLRKNTPRGILLTEHP